MGSLRLARAISLIIVITAIGALMLRGRARRYERTIDAASSTRDTSHVLDSAGAVRLALQTYEADLSARGQTSGPTRVTAFDSAAGGFRVELSPPEGAGSRVEVRIAPDGRAELRYLAPLGRD
jgi:hypothetical protein